MLAYMGSYKWLADVVKQAQKPMLPLCQFNAYIGSLTTNLLTPWFLGGHPFLPVNVNKIIIIRLVAVWKFINNIQDPRQEKPII